LLTVNGIFSLLLFFFSPRRDYSRVAFEVISQSETKCGILVKINKPKKRAKFAHRAKNHGPAQPMAV
jgi:hypothetical protein